MSKIEWTDKTWNVITGCTQTSPACQNCYAKAMTNRLEGMAKKWLKTYTHNAKKPKLHFSLNNGEIVRKKSNQCKVLIMIFYTKLKTQNNSQKIEKD